MLEILRGSVGCCRSRSYSSRPGSNSMLVLYRKPTVYQSRRIMSQNDTSSPRIHTQGDKSTTSFCTSSEVSLSRFTRRLQRRAALTILLCSDIICLFVGIRDSVAAMMLLDRPSLLALLWHLIHHWRADLPII